MLKICVQKSNLHILAIQALHAMIITDYVCNFITTVKLLNINIFILFVEKYKFSTIPCMHGVRVQLLHSYTHLIVLINNVSTWILYPLVNEKRLISHLVQHIYMVNRSIQLYTINIIPSLISTLGFVSFGAIPESSILVLRR